MKFQNVTSNIEKNIVFDEFNFIRLKDIVVLSYQCHFLIHDYCITKALIAIGEKPKQT